MEITKLVIRRKEWGGGWMLESYPHAVLNTKKGQPTVQKMCPLGFLGEACGVPRKEMEGKCYPMHYDKSVALWPAKFIHALGCADLASEVTFINDTGDNDARKEADLTSLFAENGIELTFVD